MTDLLVLRPEPGAAATVAAARAAGLSAMAAPLFTVRALDPGPWQGPTPDALLLTSANAARSIDARRWQGRPVYAVGAATAAAARAAGFAQVVAGAADAEAIVARAAADGHRRLLHLAGREHRAVAHPALTIEALIVYASDAVTHLPPAARAALDAGAVALLHSPRAAALFAHLLADRAEVRIAAFSPAVAAATGEGWRAVAVAARPTDAALLAVAAGLCEGRADRSRPAGDFV